jgi:hypothetical protein
MIFKQIQNFFKWLFSFFIYRKKQTGPVKIKVQDILDDVVSFSQVRQLLAERIESSNLFAPDIYLLAKVALDQFDFPAAKDNNAIEKYALELLTVFYPETYLSTEEMLQKFIERFLDIEGLPVDKKREFEIRPINDLAVLDQLLDKYRNDPNLGLIIAGEEKGRGQKGYWMEAFYYRTVAKRKKIADYLANELETMVLRFSKPGFRSYLREDGVVKGPFDDKEKYPYLDLVINDYKFTIQLDMEKLDWEALNPVRNKIFSHHFNSDYTKRYSPDIKNEILNDLDTAVLLDKINIMVDRIPTIMGRKVIFEELRDLFNSGKFYGFYALAMPQVEGVFVEMCQLINPDYKPSGSLPKKVKWLRPYSETNEFDFDYYEFYLPEDRNRFSHYGKDSEIEFRSRCLLLDLINVLTTCENLTSPLIYLTNIITEGVNEIAHIGDLAKLVKLTDQTRKMAAFADIKSKLKEFVYNNIEGKYALDQYVDNLQIQYDEAVNDFSKWIGYGFLRRELPELNFKEMKPQEVIWNLDIIKESFEEWKFAFGENLMFLIDVHDTLHYLPLLFPEISQPLKDAIARFKTINATTWKNLDLVKKKIELQYITDGYMITKQARMAQLEIFLKP